MRTLKLIALGAALGAASAAADAQCAPPRSSGRDAISAAMVQLHAPASSAAPAKPVRARSGARTGARTRSHAVRSTHFKRRHAAHTAVAASDKRVARTQLADTAPIPACGGRSKATADGDGPAASLSDVLKAPLEGLAPWQATDLLAASAPTGGAAPLGASAARAGLTIVGVGAMPGAVSGILVAVAAAGVELVNRRGGHGGAEPGTGARGGLLLHPIGQTPPLAPLEDAEEPNAPEGGVSTTVPPDAPESPGPIFPAIPPVGSVPNGPVTPVLPTLPPIPSGPPQPPSRSTPAEGPAPSFGGVGFDPITGLDQSPASSYPASGSGGPSWTGTPTDSSGVGPTATPVPEPATTALLAAGALLLGLVPAWRRARARA